MENRALDNNNKLCEKFMLRCFLTLSDISIRICKIIKSISEKYGEIPIEI